MLAMYEYPKAPMFVGINLNSTKMLGSDDSTAAAATRISLLLSLQNAQGGARLFHVACNNLDPYPKEK